MDGKFINLNIDNWLTLKINTLKPISYPMISQLSVGACICNGAIIPMVWVSTAQRASKVPFKQGINGKSLQSHTLFPGQVQGKNKTFSFCININ